MAVVNGIVQREQESSQKDEAKERVRQALRRFRGGFHALADFALYDYGDMHPEDVYKRPPEELSDLLDHFRDGMQTSVGLPESPGVVAATSTLANYVEEQFPRHERVLDHDFVRFGWSFVRAARIAERRYFDERPRPKHMPSGVTQADERRKRSALEAAATAASTFYDGYLPYANEYLDDAAVVLSPEEITDAKLLVREREQPSE